jgi:hypothetical protein
MDSQPLDSENVPVAESEGHEGARLELVPSPGVLPRVTIHLKTADAVRVEMAKIYKGAKTGTIDVRKACQLTYILPEIRRAIETDLLERRLDALEREQRAFLPPPAPQAGE